jgi:hypothetical protein
MQQHEAGCVDAESRRTDEYEADNADKRQHGAVALLAEAGNRGSQAHVLFLSGDASNPAR